MLQWTRQFVSRTSSMIASVMPSVPATTTNDDGTTTDDDTDAR